MSIQQQEQQQQPPQQPLTRSPSLSSSSDESSGEVWNSGRGVEKSSRRKSWCPADDPCRFCKDYVLGGTLRQACTMRPKNLKKPRRTSKKKSSQETIFKIRGYEATYEATQFIEPIPPVLPLSKPILSNPEIKPEIKQVSFKMETKPEIHHVLPKIQLKQEPKVDFKVPFLPPQNEKKRKLEVETPLEREVRLALSSWKRLHANKEVELEELNAGKTLLLLGKGSIPCRAF